MPHIINKVITSTASILTLGENRLSILIFHRVLESYDFMRPGEITATEFNAKMQLIARYFTPLSLSDAVEGLKQGTLPTRAICVTFDDGYRDNAEVAYPILKRWDIPATFFVATGFLNGGRMWNDSVIETCRSYNKPTINLSDIGLGDYSLETEQQREQAAQGIIAQVKHLPQAERAEKVQRISTLVDKLPNDLMMESEHVKNMSEQGISIGGHTVTHPILATLALQQAQHEIGQGKKDLEAMIQEPVTAFAYPNGRPGQDYLLEHVEVVKNLGFETAVSTQWGVSNSKSDIFQLNRFTPWDKPNPKFLMRLVKNSLVLK